MVKSLLRGGLLLPAIAVLSCSPPQPVAVPDRGGRSCEPGDLWPRHWACDGPTAGDSAGQLQICSAFLGPRPGARVIDVDCSAQCIETAVEDAIAAREKEPCWQPLVFRLKGPCGALKLGPRHADVTFESADPIHRATVCGADRPARCQPCVSPSSYDSCPAETAIHIEGTHDVGIYDLEIVGLKTATPGCDAVGIRVEGSHRIAVVNNHLSQIQVDWKNASGRVNDLNARGIWVSGTRERPSSKIAVAKNQLSELQLGYSEALALSGDVIEFIVAGNTLEHVDNIAIDIEGDRDGVARDGRVCGNIVGPLDPGNKAYLKCDDRVATIEKGVPSCAAPADLRPHAGGIYIDGGRQVDIGLNKVSGFDYGIQVSREQWVPPPTGVRIWSNELTQNAIANIHLGFAERGVGDCGTHIFANTFGPVVCRALCTTEDARWTLDPAGICSPSASFYAHVEDMSCAPRIDPPQAQAPSAR